MQQQQLPQPQIIEPSQPVQVQPIQEIVLPSYPLNRVIGPRKITHSFQNLIIHQLQQVQIVFVDEFQMVPSLRSSNVHSRTSRNGTLQ